MPVSVFPCFRVSQKRKIKRSPIDLKLHRTYFWTRISPRSIGDGPGESRAADEGGGRAHPPGRAPLPRGQHGDPPTYFFLLYIPIYPKNFEEHNRSGVPPPEASVATENQSRPVPTPCRRGQSFSGGHLHHPGALHDKEGVVLPRG